MFTVSDKPLIVKISSSFYNTNIRKISYRQFIPGHHLTQSVTLEREHNSQRITTYSKYIRFQQVYVSRDVDIDFKIVNELK